MAKEIGAFDKYGADPNLIFISSSPVMVPALISGDVLGGIAGANAVISAVLGGAIPRVEPEAVSATLEFMGKKGLPIETFADNSIIDRLVREGFIDQVYKKR
jgi:hypothetical protein